MKRSITAAAITGSLVVASALAGTAPASAQASPQAVPNSKPSWTAHAKNLGRTSNSAKVAGRVYLAPQGGLTALKNYALAVSTPGSANYQHFLSSAQYYSRFGTTDATVQAVSKYLKSAGLSVDSVGAHNKYLVIHGTTRQAEKAFDTSIDRYNHNGQNVQAPATAAKLPASLASSVLTITGLDTTQHLSKPTSQRDAPPSDGFRNARPCSTYFGQLAATNQADHRTPLPKFQGKTLPYVTCGYNGVQLRNTYEGATNLTGNGVTVGIIDAYASPTIAYDSNHYAEANGDGSYVPGQLKEVHPGTFTQQKLCGPSGWYGEETLDVEAVHAMAPDANIRYYAAKSCLDSDLTDALQTVVDENKVQIVSNSYGDLGETVPEDSIQAFESVALQGAIQGISIAFSSGDSGDDLAASGIKQADWPATDPYVTAVGGTSVAIGPNFSREFETGWGTVKYNLNTDGKGWTSIGFTSGAGGGSSTLFNRPSYQDGATGAGSRQVPDVAMDADPNTGMLIGQTQTFPDGVYYDQYRIGGTSLASPLFAGMTALALQNAGHSGGLLNPTIYSHRGAFIDIKGQPPVVGVVRSDFVDTVDPRSGIVYSVRLFNHDSSLSVKSGYDQVTGVGVPSTKWLSTIKNS